MNRTGQLVMMKQAATAADLGMRAVVVVYASLSVGEPARPMRERRQELSARP